MEIAKLNRPSGPMKPSCKPPTDNIFFRLVSEFGPIASCFSLGNVADVNVCKMSSSSAVLIGGFAKQLVVHRFPPVPIKY